MSQLKVLFCLIILQDEESALLGYKAVYIVMYVPRMGLLDFSNMDTFSYSETLLAAYQLHGVIYQKT